eukprot:gnl/Chilomastix_cuspidata/3842.p1 GENE.gnl/Chilomastix_cuspidata/3842~~gnl/Chilomastix_cuspidata/3842.p1  ORF type:complete len:290 (-),score=103.86 gnl/Chilomastix_cuspidata/3842:7-876(-)
MEWLSSLALWAMRTNVGSVLLQYTQDRISNIIDIFEIIQTNGVFSSGQFLIVPLLCFLFLCFLNFTIREVTFLGLQRRFVTAGAMDAFFSVANSVSEMVLCSVSALVSFLCLRGDLGLTTPPPEQRAHAAALVTFVRLCVFLSAPCSAPRRLARNRRLLAHFAVQALLCAFALAARVSAQLTSGFLCLDAFVIITRLVHVLMGIGWDLAARVATIFAVLLLSNSFVLLRVSLVLVFQQAIAGDLPDIVSVPSIALLCAAVALELFDTVRLISMLFALPSPRRNQTVAPE